MEKLFNKKQLSGERHLYEDDICYIDSCEKNEFVIRSPFKIINDKLEMMQNKIEYENTTKQNYYNKLKYDPVALDNDQVYGAGAHSTFSREVLSVFPHCKDALRRLEKKYAVLGKKLPTKLKYVDKKKNMSIILEHYENWLYVDNQK